MDGQPQYANDTYCTTRSNVKSFTCDYTVVSTVTRVATSGSSVVGETTAATMPGCAGLIVAQVCLTMYVPLSLLAIILYCCLVDQAYGKTMGCNGVSGVQSMRLFHVTLWWTIAQMVVAVVEVCGMLVFATSDGFDEPTLGAIVYVQPVMVVWLAGLAVWVLTILHRDVQKRRVKDRKSAEYSIENDPAFQ